LGQPEFELLLAAFFGLGLGFWDSWSLRVKWLPANPAKNTVGSNPGGPATFHEWLYHFSHATHVTSSTIQCSPDTRFTPNDFTTVCALLSLIAAAHIEWNSVNGSH
jgi:hypothetical protein